MSAPIETRCNTCGRPVNTADRYCGFCGARLDGENLTPTAETTGPHRPHVDRILASLRAATIGEYDIAGELGRGGMAVVFLAHELSLNRKVAIKALLPELLYTEGMDRRFKHEARIAAKLDHPNILVIHGVREATDLLFIVMKLVEGLPLSAILKGGAPLPIPVVRLILRNVADALSYAHGEGVVHRDVKPANIMVDRRGNVVVMDFGIAKAADDAHLTRTGLVIGTPAYMSPEQCLAQGVSAASDQYSLGVVAFELLTGRTPFRGSALEMQWAHATAAPPTVRSLRPDCPPELDAVVMRMMAKAPGERWSTLHDVSHALADDASTVKTARAALVALVNDAPDRHDATLPTTPASPVPIGPGPVAVGDATTDPVRATSAPPPTPSASGAPNVAAAVSPLLTLSQERIELSTGDSVELMVELDANDQATDGTPVEWQSSNPGVALVSRDGFVTAVGPGLTEVVCTWRGRRAVCLVHVTAAAAAAALPATPLPPRQATPVAAVAERSGPRRMWWIGALAAGIAVFAVYRGMKPSDVTPPNVATPPEAPAPTRPLPVASVPAAAPPAGRTVADSIGSTVPKVASSQSDTARAKSPSTAVAQKGGAGARVVGPAGRTAVGSSSTATSPGTRPAVPDPRAATATNQQPTPVPPVAPPTVPLARPDSVRLTTRVDTGAGYGASRTAPPTSSPTPASPAPAPARDTADDRIPPAPREIATALFKEFANAINARAYSRITGAYSQPNDPAAIKLWQDFLVFVRDYTPRATVRSTTVNESSNPPTITATIDFRWSSDAGFERTRAGTFVGIGVPIPGGWQLHRAHLEKKFW